MTDSTPNAAADPVLHVLSPNLSAAEIAAVTAVIGAAVEEELAELQDDVRIGPSAWERSQRSLRTPLHPHAGAWRGFTA